MPARGANAGNARISTMPKVFLDTDMLVYSLDHSDAGKRDKCRCLIKTECLNVKDVLQITLSEMK